VRRRVASISRLWPRGVGKGRMSVGAMALRGRNARTHGPTAMAGQGPGVAHYPDPPAKTQKADRTALETTADLHRTGVEGLV